MAEHPQEKNINDIVAHATILDEGFLREFKKTDRVEIFSGRQGTPVSARQGTPVNIFSL